MIIEVFIGIAWLILASITDIKKKIIPNWLTGSMFLNIAIVRVIYSLTFHRPELMLQALFGFLLFAALGIALFKFEIMAGGDSKLMMSIGIMLFIFPNIIQNIGVTLIFCTFFAAVVFVYGVFMRIKTGKSRMMAMAPAFFVSFALTQLSLVL